jgi:hypothetical protein
MAQAVSHITSLPHGLRYLSSVTSISLNRFRPVRLAVTTDHESLQSLQSV